MRTTIDAAGRIVVPKSIRQAMGLTAGSAIDVTFVNDRIQIEVAFADVRVEQRDGFAAIVPVDPDAPPYTDDMMYAAIDASRRWPR